MILFDRFIGIFAPHRCIFCEIEGYIVCPSCSYTELSAHVSDCYKCAKSTNDFATCKSCRRSSPIKSLISTTYLDEKSKRIIYRLKFDKNISVSKEIARIMDEILPMLSEDTIITFVPTSSSRIRKRGYDHSLLIAKEFARRRNLKFIKLIIKTNQTRQVGATKKQRLSQAHESYRSKKSNISRKQPVIIIDDIATTGATLEACTKILKNAGFKDVHSLVFARD